MGEVTIDSIQIEIESNSTNASKGLDALAGSLEKLKKNGSFKTVSTNLNNLSDKVRQLPLCYYNEHKQRRCPYNITALLFYK